MLINVALFIAALLVVLTRDWLNAGVGGLLGVGLGWRPP